MRGLIATVLAGLLASATAADAPPQFVVIVNAANPSSEIAASEASRIFLKRVTVWKGSSEKVRPVDLAESSPVREAFSRLVHGKRTQDIEAHWQTMIFSGRDVPPPKKASEEEVVSFVARHPGGIGYVSATAALGAGVKVLKLTN
jgi:ABC-type phosphate transport system substrate-binding protein